MAKTETTRFAVIEQERVVKVHERKIPELKADEVDRGQKESEVSYGIRA